MNQRTCERCGLDKPLSSFSFHDKKDGRRKPHCKECGVKAHTLAASRKPSGVLPPRAAYQHQYRTTHPERRRATRLIQKHISTGKLTRQPCEVCGVEKTQAHHDDYSKPLDVRWLCRNHHMQHHAELRRQQRSAA